jgi:hypothetical protein
MSLDTWLGSTKKVDARSLSPVKATKTARIVLGILGARANMTYEAIQEEIIEPAITAWGVPDEVLLPAQGESSYTIQSWAATKEIPVSLVTADWTLQGSKAGFYRDARIQRDATHLILLQGPRSTALAALAARLQRKGRPVLLSERPGLKAGQKVAA